MRKILSLLAIGSMLIACKNDEKSKENENSSEMAENNLEMKSPELADTLDIEIEPISHATAVFKWGGKTFYSDPVGGAEAFSEKDKADFILITDIHGDHMNAETLKALELGETKIIVPQAVKEKLPQGSFVDPVVIFLLLPVVL